MISKEERAELREWANNPEELLRNWTVPLVYTEGVPSLLDALDAADERIAELEAIWKLREKEHELAARMVNRRSEELKEAKARIAELEAAAQWRPIEEAPDGRRVQVCIFATRIGPPQSGTWWGTEGALGGAPTYFREPLPIPALPEGGA